MRIIKAIFVNAAPFGNRTFDFSDCNLSIFTGINGSGKTTILSYIADAFYEFARKCGAGSFSNPNSFYRISSTSSNLNQNLPSIVYLRFSDSGEILDYCEANGNTTKDYYEANIKIENKIQFQSIKNGYKTITNLTPDFYGGIFEKELLSFFPAYRFNVPDYLNQELKLRTSKGSFDINDGYRNRIPSPIEQTSDYSSDIQWLLDVVLDERSNYKQTDEYYSACVDAINTVLENKIKKKVRLAIGPRKLGENRVSVVSDDSEKEITYYPSIMRMSSGEIALFCLALEIIKSADAINKSPSEVSGIIVIDEIEQHLHVALESNSLPKLFCLFPKNPIYRFNPFSTISSWLRL